MTELTTQSLVDRAIAAALTGLSPASSRVYHSRMRSWIAWAGTKPLNRETVKQWIAAMQEGGTTAQVINQSLAAIKRLATEAAELGWLDGATDTQIRAIHGRKVSGVRTGRWLTAEQVDSLLVGIDRTTARGRRDAALISVLVGCGLRRAEACSLTLDQISQHNGDHLIRNLTGKGGKVRSVGIPDWAYRALESWLRDRERARADSTAVFRSFYLNGQINGSLSTTAVRDIVQRAGERIGMPDLNPHDLRRTHAKLARVGGAPLEVIQRTLGHASVRTTEIYLQSAETGNSGSYISVCS